MQDSVLLALNVLLYRSHKFLGVISNHHFHTLTFLLMLGERGGEESGALLLVLPRALRVRLGAEWGKMHTSCGARGEEQRERL